MLSQTETLFVNHLLAIQHGMLENLLPDLSEHYIKEDLSSEEFLASINKVQIAKIDYLVSQNLFNADEIIISFHFTSYIITNRQIIISGDNDFFKSYDVFHYNEVKEFIEKGLGILSYSFGINLLNGTSKLYKKLTTIPNVDMVNSLLADRDYYSSFKVIIEEVPDDEPEVVSTNSAENSESVMQENSGSSKTSLHGKRNIIYCHILNNEYARSGEEGRMFFFLGYFRFVISGLAKP